MTQLDNMCFYSYTNDYTNRRVLMPKYIFQCKYRKAMSEKAKLNNSQNNMYGEIIT